MKLYTLEQVKEAYKIGVGKGFANITIEDLKPIELPSDEEIEKAANTQEHYEGAMWLKYKILNQNK